MNKVKYDLKKILIFPLGYYFLNTVYLFYIEEGVVNYNFFSDFIILTVVMFIVTILFWKIFNDENRNESGLYFSLNECRFVQENKVNELQWNDVRTISIFELGNYFYIIKFSSLSSSFTYYTYMFFPVSESFIESVKTYVPENHELHKIIKSYSGED